MIDISTKYLGLDLKNPIIVGSCGLTNSLADIKDIQEKGAAAVVLKSIFEEEILMEYERELKNISIDESNLEYYDYLDYQIKAENINKYLKLIESCKKEIEIPIIASINCINSTEWTFFAKKIEQAGADALEVNAFVLPSDLNKSAVDTEKIYFNMIEAIRKEVKIPVALKISFYFSNLAAVIKKLSETGIDGLVLFNRFYNPDFDIEKRMVISSHVLSSPDEIGLSLRWIALMANRVNCDLAASTGIHDAKAMIKQLLAGASAVQIVSALYKNGLNLIPIMLNDLKTWMNHHKYNSIADFKGSMAQSKSLSPEIFERVQFMKYFGEAKL
jgi:dihydroorotate dehydrogenase (fumarate)